MLSASLQKELIERAKCAIENAYCDYSRFPVGAAALSASGNIYSGCNVENASYGLTICAERSSVFNAISDGQREIVAVAIYTPTKTPTPPCGACRQVIHEFGPQAVILCSCDGGQELQLQLDDLLPSRFGQDVF
ncbi:MAG: cytidine deaminase [Pirellulales bacterium]|nr:cytidine deaminase [Pirellulales bacterium]